MEPPLDQDRCASQCPRPSKPTCPEGRPGLVPVILRKVNKPKGDPEKEKMQGQIESMKAAMAVCEEACFRKLRYQKRLLKERERGDLLGEVWRDEVWQSWKRSIVR